MPTSTQLAKLTPPSIQNIYTRPRCFKELDTLRKKTGVIWLDAPAGSGKTTLIASYLVHSNLKPVWYQVDTGDNDPASFFHYLDLAYKYTSSSSGKSSALTAEYQTGTHIFSRNFFRDIFSNLSDKNILIFDNYQELDENSEVHSVIASGLEEIPVDKNVIIISRNKPPADFSRLLHTNRLHKLDWSIVQFNEGEQNDYIRQYYQDMNLDESQLSSIHTFTKGWITGLKLILERSADPNVISLQKVSHSEEIFQYFTTEILKHTDELTREFLLKSSLLPTMTVSTVRKLTKVASTKSILNTLTKSNFFTTRHGFFDVSFEYHPLFRKFLLNYARNHFSASEYSSLLKQAGQILAESGDNENATTLLTDSLQWATLSEIILKQAKTWIQQGRNKHLEKSILALPADILTQSSWLSFWLGHSRLQYNPVEAREYLIKSYRLFINDKDSKGIYFSLTDILQSYNLAQDNISGAREWIKEIDLIRKKWKKFPNMEMRIRLLCNSIFSMSYTVPNHADLPNYSKQIEKISMFIPHKPLRIHVGGALILYHSVTTGNYLKLNDICRGLEPLTTDSTLPPLLVITACVAVSSTRVLSFFSTINTSLLEPDAEWIKTHDYIAQGLNLSKQHGIYALIPYLLMQGSYTAIMKNELSLAEEYLNQIIECNIDGQRLNMAHYMKQRGCLEIAKGNYPEAFPFLQEALEINNECGALFRSLVTLTPLILTCIKLEKYDLAGKYYDAATELAEQTGNQAFYTYLNSIKVYYCYHINDHEGMLLALRQTLQAVREFGDTGFIPHNFACLQLLCEQAILNDIETETVKKLIRIYNISPSQDARFYDNWPHRIKIYTLGRFRIVVNNETLVSTGKSQKKPLELLKALIALGGRDVPTERLANALWPEAEGDSAYENLRTNLKRLRKLLTYSDAISLSEGKLSLENSHCWIDLWAFERGVGESQDYKQLNRTLKLYQGDLFSSESNHYFILAPRERLRQTLLDKILNFGKTLQKNKNYQEAIDLFRRGLDIDPLSEPLYLQLMQCHINTGQLSEAIKTYCHCEELLDGMLKIKPSDSIQALFQNIVTGKNE